MRVYLVNDHYHRLHGLDVARQRLIFNGKVMSDEDNLHSHGVLDGSIIHLVRQRKQNHSETFTLHLLLYNRPTYNLSLLNYKLLILMPLEHFSFKVLL